MKRLQPKEIVLIANLALSVKTISAGYRTIAILLAALSLVFIPTIGHTLVIHMSETDFLAAASIQSTQTFDGFTANYGFIHHSIALDGVMYSANECTNRCWNFDQGLGGILTTGLLSNAVVNNVLSFGSGRYVMNFGLNFISAATSGGVWDISVLETDGNTTEFSITGIFNLVHGSPKYLGFISSVGISHISFFDSFTGNWVYDDVSRSPILGGPALSDCTPVPPPGLGGPGGISPDFTCIEDETALPDPIPGPSNPIPEPSTMLLLGTGLVGLIGYRWKKAQA